MFNQLQGTRNLTLNRDSVCMGDDCFSHRENITVNTGMRLSWLLQRAAMYVPYMENAVWAVRAGERICGYILQYGTPAAIEVAGEDVTVGELESAEIKCRYYYEKKFTWIDSRTGEQVEKFRDCRTFLEKVKRSEEIEAESGKIIKDMKSGNANRIWDAACKIISMGQEAERIRPFFYYVSSIESDTKGVELGGGILPNRRFVEFAIKTIEFHKEGRGCPCQLYARCGSDSIFSPKQEEEKGYVRILETVYERGSRFVDHYVVQCTRCGQQYRVTEEVGHMKIWKWQEM